MRALIHRWSEIKRIERERDRGRVDLGLDLVEARIRREHLVYRCVARTQAQSRLLCKPPLGEHQFSSSNNNNKSNESLQ